MTGRFKVTKLPDGGALVDTGYSRLEFDQAGWNAFVLLIAKSEHCDEEVIVEYGNEVEVTIDDSPDSSDNGGITFSSLQYEFEGFKAGMYRAMEMLGAFNTELVAMAAASTRNECILRFLEWKAANDL